MERVTSLVGRLRCYRRLWRGAFFPSDTGLHGTSAVASFYGRKKGGLVLTGWVSFSLMLESGRKRWWNWIWIPPSPIQPPYALTSSSLKHMVPLLFVLPAVGVKLSPSLLLELSDIKSRQRPYPPLSSAPSRLCAFPPCPTKFRLLCLPAVSSPAL